ncbi:MAG TPA: TIGR03936 family radical SAM-associated protein [Coriobacteriia bacterium]|nr:TIGR03936 family radical SAM-associated protein [Coriobacteriia bacterium]
MPAGEYRVRFRYAKSGRARFLSHLEVMRALERSARRARLPYAVTRGFNPRMKASFGPALPVGTAGTREYFDVWLTEPLPAEVARARMAAYVPVGLCVSGARYVAEREPSLSAAAAIARYELEIGGEGLTADLIRTALETVIAGGRLELERKGKTKVFDLARSLPEKPRVGSAGPPFTVQVATRLGAEGSLRPESLLTEALSRIPGGGVVQSVTRTDIFMEDGGVLLRPL